MTATATRKRAQAVPEGLTEAEFERLMDPSSVGDPRSSTYKRDRMLLELLAGTGLRINEALSLTRLSVNLNRGSVWVAPEHSKTGKGRAVFYGPTLRGKLEAYLADMPAGQDLLFVTRTGAALSDSHVRRLFKKIARRAGLDPERVHPHALRHLFALRTLDAGGHLNRLRSQLGHARISTTATYLQAASWHRAEEAARLDL